MLQRATGRTSSRLGRSVRKARWGVALLATVVVVLLVRTTVLAPYVVASGSMEPTVEEGAVVLVEKVSHHWDAIGRADLVVIQRADALVLKRVVGIAGDVVTMRDGVLYVNGAAVQEPYVDLASVDGTYFGRVSVPAGHVFVLGDRREGSIDSRSYGPVDLAAVRGRVLLHW